MCRHISRKILAWCMTGTLLLSGFSAVPVLAEDAGDGEAVCEEVLNYRSEDERQADSIEAMVPMPQCGDSGIPKSYKTDYITSIKNQNPLGTCWAHAFIAASESNLIKKGLADTTLDLSEWQLAYFCGAANTADPLGLTIGDSFTSGTASANYLMVGGNQQVTVRRVADWIGLVEESKAPYSTVLSNQEAVLQDILAYETDAYHLENAYYISMKDRTLVKQMIMSMGSCATSYRHDYSYFNVTSGYSLPSGQTIAEYCPSEVSTNHAITIVGWDDNYSKDNFGDNKPTADGAWLCRNNYGTNWGEKGFFWISYEDVPLNNGNAHFYDLESADNYDYNYQYDGGAIDTSGYNTHYEANIYTAVSYETLEAVGFYTENSNYQCKVSIYKGSSMSHPTDGELIETIVADQLYMGFHTVELDKPVYLKKGESFSVVIYQATDTGGVVPIYLDGTKEGTWYKNVSAAAAGQSFISNSGTASSWKDVGKESGANCRIKAYTSKTEDILVESIAVAPKTLELYAGQEADLAVTVLPEETTHTEVIWSSTDSGVVQVDQSGHVTAGKTGTATVTCTSADDSSMTDSCTINVKPSVSSVSLSNTKLTLIPGEMGQLEVTILPVDAVDKNVTWSTSNPEVVTVQGGMVTARAVGNATITCVSVDNPVCSASCEVIVRQPDSKTPSKDDTGSQPPSDKETTESEDIKVGKLILSKTALTLLKGKSKTLKVTVMPENASNTSVKWSSSNTKVARVNQNGKITAVGKGTAIITCKAKDGSGVKASLKVTVRIPVKKLKLSKTKVTLKKGKTLKLNVKASPANAYNKKVSWYSSNKKVVKVSSSGKLTALKRGTAIITCKAKDGSGVKVVCKVTVK